MPAQTIHTARNTLQNVDARSIVRPSTERPGLFERPYVPTSSHRLERPCERRIYRGNQRLAPYCSRFSKGTAVPREKVQLSLFSPFFIKPVRLLTADEISTRAR